MDTFTTVQVADHVVSTACVYSLLGKGYKLSVYSEEGVEVEDSTDAVDVLTTMFNLDSCALRGSKGGKDVVSLFFVYGNDGYDCIADSATNRATTKFCKELEPLLEYFEDQFANAREK